MEKKFKNDVNVVDKEIQELPNNLPLSDNKSVEFEEISLAFKQILATDNTDRLFDLFDTTIAVLDIEGNILVAKKWQKICTDFHRVNAESCQKCLESDTHLANDLEEGKEYTVYRCKNGMVDCASPIIIEGHHIANVYVGQFLFKEPDLSFFRANAKKYGFDEKAYMEALSDVPIIDEKSQVALHYLTEISKFISVMAIEKIRAMKLEKNYQKELNKKLNEEIEKNIKKDEMLIYQSRQAAMGDMIAMIAHQWRQPITVIGMEANNINMSIQLEEEITTEELKKMAESIAEQTQQLSKTIDDFRNFFKPNQEKVQTTVGSVLESTLKIVGKIMENKNITVTIENQSDTELLTYSNQLLQVFLNLLGNAKDILLDKAVTDPKITITIDETQDSVVTTICDNGGGIPENSIKRLGEPYFTTKEKNGTGLGLYMSITIVEKHLNGSLTWENRDEGACFIVTLRKE